MTKESQMSDQMKALEFALQELDYIVAKHGYVTTEVAAIRVREALAAQSAAPVGFSPCPLCKNPPGSRVGPPEMVRCVTDGCEGKKLAASTVAEWASYAAPPPSTPQVVEALNNNTTQSCLRCRFLLNGECHIAPPVRLPRKFKATATEVSRVRDESLIWGWPAVAPHDWCGSFCWREQPEGLAALAKPGDS